MPMEMLPKQLRSSANYSSLEDKSLILKLTDENGTKKANFDFVIEHYEEYEK